MQMVVRNHSLHFGFVQSLLKEFGNGNLVSEHVKTKGGGDVSLCTDERVEVMSE